MQTNSSGDVILNKGANTNKAKTAMDNLARDVRNVFNAFKGQAATSPQLSKLNAQAEQSVSRIRELQQSIRDMQNTFSDTPTAEMQRLIDREKELEAQTVRIKNRIKELKSYTITSPGAIEKANAELRSTEAELSQIAQKQGRLIDNGRAFQTVAQAQPQAYAQANDELRQEETKLSEIRSKMAAIGEAGRKAAAKVGQTFRKMSDTVSSGFRKIRTHAKASAGAASSSINSVNDVMKKGIKTLVKYGLGMRSLFVLFRKIRSAIVDTYKSLADNNEQIGASLKSVKDSATNLKNSMAIAIQPLVSTFAPVVASIADKLSSIMNSAGAFFAALTGQKYVYKAVKTQEEYADSLADTAENAGKAQKAVESYLSPLDDINRFTENDSTGDTGAAVTKLTTGTVPSKFQQMADTVKGYFADLFKPLKTSWEKYGSAALYQWHSALNTIKSTVGDILTSIKNVWTNGAGERIATNLIKLWGTVGGIVDGVVTSFRNAWNKDGLGDSVIQSFTDRFNSLIEFIRKVADTFKDVWKNGSGDRIWENVLTIVRNINNIIGGFWGKLKEAWSANSNGQKIWGAILGIVEKISGWFKTISSDVLGFIKNTNFTPIMDALSTIAGAFENLIGILTSKFKDVFEQILLPFAKWTIEKALPALIEALASALGVLSDIISHIPIEVIKTLTGVILGLWAAFKGVKLVSSIVAWFSKLGKGIAALGTLIADPIAAAILGIAAAITAVVTAVEIANRQKWERSDLKKATDQISEYSEKLKESTERIKTAIDTANDNILEVKADVTQVETLKERLVEIIQDGVISEKEMPEYKSIMDLLDGVEGFRDTWNNVHLQEIDGEIRVNTDEAITALNEWVEAWKEAQYKTVVQSSISELGSTLITERAKFKGSQVKASQAYSYLQTFVKGKGTMSTDEAKQFLAVFSGLIDKGKSAEAALLASQRLGADNLDVFTKLYETYLDTKTAVDENASAVNDLQNSYNGAMSALNALNGSTEDYSGWLFLVDNGLVDEKDALEKLKTTGVDSIDALRDAAAKQAKTQDEATKSVTNANTEIEQSTSNMLSRLGSQYSGWLDGLKAGVAAAVADINNKLSGIGANLGSGLALGVSVGINAIPKLAEGAVIPAGKPFISMLGDQRNGRNLEAPESLIRQIVREETANLQGNSNNTYTVPVQVGRQTLFTLVLNEAEMRRNQTGRNPFNMGGVAY